MDGDPGAPCALGIGDLHAALEAGEAGDLPAEGDYLAIGDELLAALALERLDELRIGAIEQLVRAREQAHFAGLAEREAPDPVELSLEDPIRIGERAVVEHRLHRLDPAGLTAAPELASLLGGQQVQCRAAGLLHQGQTTGLVSSPISG